MAEVYFDSSYNTNDYMNTLKADFTKRAPVYETGANGAMHEGLIAKLLEHAPPVSPVLDVGKAIHSLPEQGASKRTQRTLRELEERFVSFSCWCLHFTGRTGTIKRAPIEI